MEDPLFFDCVPHLRLRSLQVLLLLLFIAYHEQKLLHMMPFHIHTMIISLLFIYTICTGDVRHDDFVRFIVDTLTDDDSRLALCGDMINDPTFLADITEVMTVLRQVQEDNGYLME